jgi:hypothetical protein
VRNRVHDEMVRTEMGTRRRSAGRACQRADTNASQDPNSGQPESEQCCVASVTRRREVLM